MTLARLVLLLPLLLLLLLLSACTGPEPINGCLLAVARERAVLKGQTYLGADVPSRILCLYGLRPQERHVALIFRQPEGWCVFDDTGGRQLLDLPNTAAFPAPMTAARAAFPRWPIVRARWMPAAR